MILKRLFNLLPILGLLLAGYGIFGVFAHFSAANPVQAATDASLSGGGFDPVSPQPIQRAWRSVDLTTPMPAATPMPVEENATFVEGGRAALPTLAAPSTGRIPDRADLYEPENPAAVPDRIVIDSIELDAPIVRAPTRTLTLEQRVFEQWLAPDAYAAGWHQGSAFLDRPGNTVLNGHHNVFGKVFARLHELESGDLISVFSGDREFRYVVAQTMILKERDAALAEREENAAWIRQSDDRRLTLVTCWPETNNTHRLIVVAGPLE